jgi:hypothetical protein
LAFVDFQQLNQIDVIDFSDFDMPLRVQSVAKALAKLDISGLPEACTQDLGCGSNWSCLSGYCQDSVQGLAVLSHEANHTLVAVGNRSLRQFEIFKSGKVNLRTLTSSAGQYKDAPDDRLFGCCAWDSQKRKMTAPFYRFGTESYPTGAHRLSIPAVDPEGAHGFLDLLDITEGTVTLFAESESTTPLGPLLSASASRVAGASGGLTYLAHSRTGDGPDLSIFREAGPEWLLPPLDLPSDAYYNVLASGSLGFVAGSKFVSALNLVNPAIPAPVGVIDVQTPDRGQPSAFSPEPGKTYLFSPAEKAPIDIYNLSSLPGTAEWQGAINPPMDVAVSHTLVRGQFLVGYTAPQSIAGKRNLVVYHLGNWSSPGIPPQPLPTPGFEIPLAADVASLQRVVGYHAPTGEEYLYVTGTLNTPDGDGGLAPRKGTHLLRLWHDRITLASSDPIDLGQMDQYSALAIKQGSPEGPGTLYRTIYRNDSSTLALQIFDLSEATAPAKVGGEVTLLNLGENPVNRVTRLLVHADVLFVTLEHQGSWGVGAVFAQITSPSSVNVRSRLLGVGPVLAGAVLSPNRALVSSATLGMLRVDTLAPDYPRIDGGQEAPTNAVTHLLLLENLTIGGSPGTALIAVESTSVTVFQLAAQ